MAWSHIIDGGRVKIRHVSPGSLVGESSPVNTIFERTCLFPLSGDIIVIVNGDVVPADARVIPGYVSALECDEALLTGESLPVTKKSDVLDEVDCPVGDKKNMVRCHFVERRINSCAHAESPPLA